MDVFSEDKSIQQKVGSKRITFTPLGTEELPKKVKKKVVIIFDFLFSLPDMETYIELTFFAVLIYVALMKVSASKLITHLRLEVGNLEKSLIQYYRVFLIFLAYIETQ